MRILSLLFSFTLISLPVLVTAGSAGSIDLYRVAVRSDAEARVLTDIHADVLMAAGDGYLILAGPHERELLAASGLEYELIATDIDRQHLAVDFRHDPSMPLRFPVIFEDYGKRLMRVEPTDLQDTLLRDQILPIRTRIPRIDYREPTRLKSSWDAEYLGLDSLIDRVNQDSIRSYVEQLQAFPGRFMGTYGAYQACNWLVSKFREFGYDSVVIDPFIAYTYDGDRVNCRNVVAYKPGTEYPYHQIIVGAHFDAGEGSPGADDNGSGTAGVLEIARVLANVDTKLSFIFIPFDGEEHGLWGSEHYAQQAAADGDRIVLMLNMDMIGHFENDTTVYVAGGANMAYGRLWADLADSIPSIDLHGVLQWSGVSDDYSFSDRGYDILGLIEYIFSTNYHQPSDSTVYMNFDYVTRIVKANVATLAVTDAAVVLPPSLILAYPDTVPEILVPGRSNPLRIEIVPYAGAQLVPGSVMLNYRFGVDDWSSTPMTSAGGDIYEIELPTPECGNKLSFYVSAEDVATGMYFAPDSAQPLFAIGATGIAVVFEDNFDTDKGWTVSGDAHSGQWQRAGVKNLLPYNSDYDGSMHCYVTDSNINVNVDKGQTTLTSPPIELTAPDARIRLAFWYNNTCWWCQNQDDIFTIGVFNGPRFDVLETIGPVEGVAEEWQVRDYQLSDYCSPASPIRLSFIASDYGGESIVKAGVDAVSVASYSFAPNILTTTLPDVKVGVPYLQQLEALSCSTPLAWTDKYNNLAAAGLSLSTEGIISGTAADTGHFWIDAVVQDTAGRTAERWYRLHIKLDYMCGDANGDKMVNVADAVYLISYVFKGGAAPVPKNAGDANDDSWVNVGDAVYLINYVFHGGPPPVAGC